MFTPARLGLTAEELKETEQSVPPPAYPEIPSGFSPKCSENSEEDKRMACALDEQRRKFVESSFNIPPLKKPRFDDKYHRQVHTPPAVNYDSAYFPDELKISKKSRRTQKSSEASVAQIDIETELKTPGEEETECEGGAEGEETTQKSSEDDSDDEDEEESLDEEEIDEAMDYVHNYYDDYEDDGAFNEDNIDDGFAY